MNVNEYVNLFVLITVTYFWLDKLLHTDRRR